MSSKWLASLERDVGNRVYCSDLSLEKSMNRNQRILVVGATGKQGGAVARHLLKAGFPVRALTRNAEHLAAQRLANLGAELVTGNLNDRASLGPAVEGVYGVFSVQNYWEKNVGFEGEVQQGKNLADAAKQAGVRHFIQSSMAEADDIQGVEHFQSKFEIEQYIDKIGLPRTFIGLVYFMDNLLDPKMGGSMTFPVLAGNLKPQTRFHLIAVDDVGAIVTEGFKHPEQFIGKKVNAAGDCLTVDQMKQIYRKTIGKTPKSFRIPAWLFQFMSREFAQQLRWHNSMGWDFSIDEVRIIYSELMSFEQFLRQHRVTNL
jgi:uncharacterized protein YbjT (DUF2867 family)